MVLGVAPFFGAVYPRGLPVFHGIGRAFLEDLDELGEAFDQNVYGAGDFAEASPHSLIKHLTNPCMTGETLADLVSVRTTTLSSQSRFTFLIALMSRTWCTSAVP